MEFSIIVGVQELSSTGTLKLFTDLDTHLH